MTRSEWPINTLTFKLSAICVRAIRVPAMAKRLFIFLLIFLIMFRCVKGCSYIGNSVRALSNHQVRCGAYQKEEAHSAAIHKFLAARHKQKQKPSGSNKVDHTDYLSCSTYMELLVFHLWVKHCHNK